MVLVALADDDCKLILMNMRKKDEGNGVHI